MSLHSSTDLQLTIGEALGTDYFGLREPFTPQQEDYLTRTRAFVDSEVLPVINGYWERAEFPLALIEKMAPLGIIGDGIEGYGCPPMDPMSAGLINMEIHRGDGSLGTFIAVQAGLAMQSIAKCGSEEQKQRWLPPMARLDKIGAFALTEPEHGSDSVALETSARRDGESYVINGDKKWIGNGSIADVVVVWARDTSDNAVKGFLVEKGTPGYNATVMTGKASLRAVWQAEINFDDMRVPAENRLPGANSFKDCARVLTGTRMACAWMALGHAVAGFDVALTYAKRRKQFGKSLSSFQIIQQRLVKMLAEVTAMQLYCMQIAKLDAAGKLHPTLAGLAKMHNTSKARQVLSDARDLLGGNGILLDFHVIRHMVDLESIHTFEGTETVQTLLVGRDITGVAAFSKRRSQTTKRARRGRDGLKLAMWTPFGSARVGSTAVRIERLDQLTGGTEHADQLVHPPDSSGVPRACGRRVRRQDGDRVRRPPDELQRVRRRGDPAGARIARFRRRSPVTGWPTCARTSRRCWWPTSVCHWQARSSCPSTPGCPRRRSATSATTPERRCSSSTPST